MINNRYLQGPQCNVAAGWYYSQYSYWESSEGKSESDRTPNVTIHQSLRGLLRIAHVRMVSVIAKNIRNRRQHRGYSFFFLIFINYHRAFTLCSFVWAVWQDGYWRRWNDLSQGVHGNVWWIWHRADRTAYPRRQVHIKWEWRGSETFRLTIFKTAF